MIPGGSVKYWGEEKKCAICGKRFLAGDDYAYKRADKNGKPRVWFCRYNHLLEYDKAHEKKKAGKPRTDKEMEIVKLIREGHRPKAIAERMHVSISTVWYYKDRDYEGEYEE